MRRVRRAVKVLAMITRYDDAVKEKLKASRVGIAGAGGLGSNCAMALARAGVGELVIVDFDVVEEANLNRQAYQLDQVGMKKTQALKANIEAVTRGCKVTIIEKRLEPGDAKVVFEGCQVVVEAFDAPKEKAMVIEDVLATMPDTYVVAASGLAGIGGNDLIETQRIGRLFMCGDGKTEARPGVALLAPRVGVVAYLEANQTLALLLGDVGVDDEEPVSECQ